MDEAGEGHMREIMDQVERETARLDLMGMGALRATIDQVAREIVRGVLGGPGYSRPREAGGDASVSEGPVG